MFNVACPLGVVGVARVSFPCPLFLAVAEMGLAWDENGYSVTNIPLHDVEQYDIANDIWIRMKPIPSPRFRFGAAVAQDTVRVSCQGLGFVL